MEGMGNAMGGRNWKQYAFPSEQMPKCQIAFVSCNASTCGVAQTGNSTHVPPGGNRGTPIPTLLAERG